MISFVTTLLLTAILAFGQPGIDEYKYAAEKFQLGLPMTQAQVSSMEDYDVYLQEYKKESNPALQPQPGKVFNNVGFVKPDGTEFTVNGKSYYCGGTNAFYAGLDYIMSANEVIAMMDAQAAQGATILRIFTSFFDSVPNSMMPDFGVYNEQALVRLDFALAEMAKKGLRGIIVLSNYWPFLGGFSDWMNKAYPGENRPVEEFYTDAFVKSEWKKFIKMLINRKNVFTGVRYYDDPTIFAFELANEPRAQGYDKKIGKKPGETICSWAAEMTAYIRSLDKNHMIAIGDEGMRTDGPSKEPHSWINNGYEGVDFVCNLQYADFATLHSYPDAWGMSADGGYTWLGENYYKDRRDIAHSMDKPIILEEYGMRRGYLPTRNKLFSYIHDQVNSLGYACTLVWAVSHYPTTPYQYTYYGYNDGQGYVFGYSGPDTDGKASVVKQYGYMNSLDESRTPPKDIIEPPKKQCSDIPPNSQYSCQQQKAWGKCNESWMQGYCRATCGKCSTPTPPPPPKQGNPPPKKQCSDIPPSQQYTCQQQKAWGKCNESWMQGYCEATCGKCSTPTPPPPPKQGNPPPKKQCSDIPPSQQYTCQQQKAWGKCNESWMQGYCRATCGKC